MLQGRRERISGDGRLPAMRIVAQRVSEASVSVDDEVVGAIGPGVVLLVGVLEGDGLAEARVAADKLADLRIFRDDAGKMNLSVVDTAGEVLVVSQFTLGADVRRGNRPSFTSAAPPEVAQPVIDQVVRRLTERGVPVATGRFGAMMQVALVNDGPVTIVLDVVDGRVT